MEMPQLQSKSEADYSGKEKRAASRLFMQAECTLRFEDSHKIDGDITNISYSGAFVTFEHDDTESFINLRVWLEFVLLVKTKTYPMRVSGMIVRASDNGVGIAFRLSEKNRIEPVIEKLREEIEETEQSLTDRGQSLDF